MALCTWLLTLRLISKFKAKRFSLVAIKRQHPQEQSQENQGYSVSTLREINVLQELGRLGNPHVANLIEVFQLVDGSPCIVIEFLRGGSVGSFLKQ